MDLDDDDVFQRPIRDELWQRMEKLVKPDNVTILLFIERHGDENFTSLRATVETRNFQGLAARIGLNQKHKLEIIDMERQIIFPAVMNNVDPQLLTRIAIGTFENSRIDSATPGRMIMNRRQVKQINLIFGYKDDLNSEIQNHTIRLL